MSTAKNAILKAKIEGVIYEIMAKTNATNAMVDDTTTLAEKLASIVSDLTAHPTADAMEHRHQHCYQ